MLIEASCATITTTTTHFVGKDDRHCSVTRKELAEIGSYFFPPKQGGTTNLLGSETKNPRNDDSATTNKPMLEDLGEINYFSVLEIG